MNVYAKFRCAPLRIKKALGISRELITTTTRTARVAVWDLPYGSKNDFKNCYRPSWVATLAQVLPSQTTVDRQDDAASALPANKYMLQTINSELLQ